MVGVGLGAGVAGGGAVVGVGLGALLALAIGDSESVAVGESVAGGLVTTGLPQAPTRKTTATRIAISSRTARPRLRRFFTRRSPRGALPGYVIEIITYPTSRRADSFNQEEPKERIGLRTPPHHEPIVLRSIDEQRRYASEADALPCQARRRAPRGQSIASRERPPPDGTRQTGRRWVCQRLEANRDLDRRRCCRRIRTEVRECRVRGNALPGTTIGRCPDPAETALLTRRSGREEPLGGHRYAEYLTPCEAITGRLRPGATVGGPPGACRTAAATAGTVPADPDDDTVTDGDAGHLGPELRAGPRARQRLEGRLVGHRRPGRSVGRCPGGGSTGHRPDRDEARAHAGDPGHRAMAKRGLVGDSGPVQPIARRPDDRPDRCETAVELARRILAADGQPAVSRRDDVGDLDRIRPDQWERERVGSRGLVCLLYT